MSVEFLTLTEREKFQYCPTLPPTSPMRDWRWWSLVVPSVATAFGLFLFGVFAVGFTQLRDLPDQIKFIVVALGAVCIPFGSELGTVSSVIEIFRKHFGPTGATKLDWAGLITSTCTSITGVILSWAYLLSSDTAWSSDVRTWGPLVFGALMVLDFTFSLLETGAYLGSYDKRFQEWYKRDFSPWIKKKEKMLDKRVEEEYNWGTGLKKWPEEPPVKEDDTPVKLPEWSTDRLDAFAQAMQATALRSRDYDGIAGDTIVATDPSNGKDYGARVTMRKLDSGEVEIEDIEHLHPAVARSILEE